MLICLFFDCFPLLVHLETQVVHSDDLPLPALKETLWSDPCHLIDILPGLLICKVSIQNDSHVPVRADLPEAKSLLGQRPEPESPSLGAALALLSGGPLLVGVVSDRHLYSDNVSHSILVSVIRPDVDLDSVGLDVSRKEEPSRCDHIHRFEEVSLFFVVVCGILEVRGKSWLLYLLDDHGLGNGLPARDILGVNVAKAMETHRAVNKRSKHGRSHSFGSLNRKLEGHRRSVELRTDILVDLLA